MNVIATCCDTQEIEINVIKIKIINSKHPRGNAFSSVAEHINGQKR